MSSSLTRRQGFDQGPQLRIRDVGRALWSMSTPVTCNVVALTLPRHSRSPRILNQSGRNERCKYKLKKNPPRTSGITFPPHFCSFFPVRSSRLASESSSDPIAHTQHRRLFASNAKTLNPSIDRIQSSFMTRDSWFVIGSSAYS